MWRRECVSASAAGVAIAHALLRLTFPFGCMVVVIALAAGVWWVESADTGLLIAAVQIALIYLIGVLLPFFLHEWAHAWVALHAPGVRAVDVESTLLRISVRPKGTMARRHMLRGAIAGPGICVVIGAAAFINGAALVGAAFVWHGIFLTPVFGDGRVMLRALLGGDAPPSHTTASRAALRCVPGGWPDEYGVQGD